MSSDAELSTSEHGDHIGDSHVRDALRESKGKSNVKVNKAIVRVIVKGYGKSHTTEVVD